jgi:transcriptional regulator of acetoin/glycerol metabolism
MEWLQSFSWLGNVRELRNVIERAVILSDGGKLYVSPPDASHTPAPTSVKMQEVQRKHILKVIQQTGWRVRGSNGAAEIQGMEHTTLENRMKRLGVDKPKRH